VRVEIMGSQKCRIVGKSQSALILINPVIFTRTRTLWAASSSPKSLGSLLVLVLVLLLLLTECAHSDRAWPRRDRQVF
jgi:cytochrome bd-type quinol oxidase subunit 2